MVAPAIAIATKSACESLRLPPAATVASSLSRSRASMTISRAVPSARVHCRVVDQDGVAGADQRRHFRSRSRLSRSRTSSSTCASVRSSTFLLVLFPAPLRANFRRSSSKDLQFSVRENDGADVAAFHHDAATSAGTLLLRNEHGTHGRDSSKPGSSLSYFRRTNLLGDFLAVEKYAILDSVFFLLWSWAT